MRFFLFIYLSILIGCPKHKNNKDKIPTSLYDINFEIDDLEELPESDDTGFEDDDSNYEDYP